MTSVVVFGCGPSGLFAAWAAEQAGATVRIISKKRRSELFGAQHLHQPIPGVKAEEREIEYKLLGTPEEYRRRVYGAMYDGATSVSSDGVHKSDMVGSQSAWDIRGTYNYLYDYFEPRIEHVKAMDGLLFKALIESNTFGQYDHIINSIPLPVLCLKPDLHKFHSQRIWAMGDAPERGQSVPFDCPPDKVLCNGLPSDHPTGDVPDWYRLSNIFGYRTVEWPAWFYPGIKLNAAEVQKPLGTTCDCHSEVRMVGRFGRWEKGVLSHHAYDDVEELLTGASL